MRRDKINKFLSLYSRILMAVFGISLIMSGVIVLASDAPTCYEQASAVDNQSLYQNRDKNIDSDCATVEDVDNIRNKFVIYKWVSIGCLAGIFAIRTFQKKTR